jgi:hypothetical protein
MSVDDHHHRSAADDPAVAEARALSASWTDDDVYAVLAASELTPAPWRQQLPTEGIVLNRVIAPTGRQWWFVLLDNPLLHRLPDGANLSRYPAEYLTRHDGADCFWAYALLIATADRNNPILLGATGHLVDVAVVVDVSVREDVEIDSDKIDLVGQGRVDVGLSAPEVAGDGAAESTTPVRPSPTAAPVRPPQHAGSVPAAPFDEQRTHPVVTEAGDSKWVLAEIQRYEKMLRPLVGEVAMAEIPVPEALPKGVAPTLELPQFVVDGAHYGYYSPHPRDGYTWRTTTDPHELVYWCVDDMARFLAWRWAQRAPSFVLMPKAVAQRALWAPYWQVLMTALDPQWGARTGRAVRELL